MHEEINSRSSQYVGEGGIMRNNSGTENMTQSRGGFIKKRAVPEVSANHLGQILDHLNESNIKNQEDDDPLKTLNQ